MARILFLQGNSRSETLHIWGLDFDSVQVEGGLSSLPGPVQPAQRMWGWASACLKWCRILSLSGQGDGGASCCHRTGLSSAPENDGPPKERNRAAGPAHREREGDRPPSGVSSPSCRQSSRVCPCGGGRDCDQVSVRNYTISSSRSIGQKAHEGYEGWS